MIKVCYICLPAGEKFKNDEVWAAMGLLCLAVQEEACEAKMITRQTDHAYKLIEGMDHVNQVCLNP